MNKILKYEFHNTENNMTDCFGLNQKVMCMDRMFEFRSTQSMTPPVDRQILSHRVKSMEHGKPDCLRENGNRPVRAGDRQAGKRSWKKRMSSCNEADRGSKFALTRKGADFQQVLNHEKGLENNNRTDTDRQQPKAADGLSGRCRKWNSIIWKKIIEIVKRLQARIVKAEEAGDKRKFEDYKDSCDAQKQPNYWLSDE